MNFVEPIRDRKKIAQIKNQLRGQHRYRDLLMFVVGINTALRISDLLELRIEHFLDDGHLTHKRGNRLHGKFRPWKNSHQVIIKETTLHCPGEKRLQGDPEIVNCFG